MGGHKKKNIAQNHDDKTNYQNPRIPKNDESLWPVFLELVDEKKDQFPFGPVQLMRRTSKPNSITMITRERGGLTNWFNAQKTAFTLELRLLVKSEHARSGDIGLSFCRKLGFLIVSYYELFAYDIINGSHRNTEMMVEVVSPLLLDKGLLYFGAETYMMLKEWYQNDGFTRESVLSGYDNKLKQLFNKYQVVRPDKDVLFSGERGSDV